MERMTIPDVMVIENVTRRTIIDASEVRKMAMDLYWRLKAIEEILGDDYDLDRLRELVEADREGRCVVLPCKIEDDVYINLLGKTLPFSVISISQMASTPTLKAMHGVRLCYIFKADDVGKTVFRTREAAEQALREE